MSTQQPPPSGQPPYGPPPPPGQPYPPYGPPPIGPRKSNRALIAVIVIVALVVAGGAVGGGLLIFTADDSTETFEGDGYSYEIPGGWSDTTSQANTEGIDSVVRSDEDDDGFHSNLFVEIDPVEGVTDVAEIQEEWATNTAKSVNATPEPIDDISLDGEDAVGIRLETTAQDIDVVQVAYLAVKDGKAYSIVLSSSAGAEDDAAETLDELLNSWSWQSAEAAA